MTNAERQELNERMERHCRTAMTVQDASNLSGVIHTFNEILSDVWMMARALGQGTAWVNQHPICRLYASKVAHLTGMFACASTLTFHAEAEELCQLYVTGSANLEVGRLLPADGKADDAPA